MASGTIQVSCATYLQNLYKLFFLKLVFHAYPYVSFKHIHFINQNTFRNMSEDKKVNFPAGVSSSSFRAIPVQVICYACTFLDLISHTRFGHTAQWTRFIVHLRDSSPQRMTIPPMSRT